MNIDVRFKLSNISAPIDNKSANNTKACFIERFPDASGLVLVLFTSLSISLSIISLIIQPADLIIILPTKNNGNKIT